MPNPPAAGGGRLRGVRPWRGQGSAPVAPTFRAGEVWRQVFASALAIEMARSGAQLFLLARTSEALQDVAGAILEETGHMVGVIACDLANGQSASEAGARLAAQHSDLDGLIHNGAMWLPGPMKDVPDIDIQACVASAAIGSLILTRHLLPNLKARADLAHQNLPSAVTSVIVAADMEPA